MNRRMFFGILGAPLVAKKQVTKEVLPKVIAVPHAIYYGKGKCMNTWKFKIADMPSQVA